MQYFARSKIKWDWAVKGKSGLKVKDVWWAVYKMRDYGALGWEGKDFSKNEGSLIQVLQCFENLQGV